MLHGTGYGSRLAPSCECTRSVRRRSIKKKWREIQTDGHALAYTSESVRNMKTVFFCFLLVTAAAGEIHQNPGSITPLPHQKYIRVVSEADSPIQQTYIKSKDGLYIAAAIQKPKGDG